MAQPMPTARKDFETSLDSAEAWITVAYIRMLTRRLARYHYAISHFKSGTETCQTRKKIR